ncbi:LpqN/LpqT family lipoprotein [Mycolicibacterium sp. 120270]|uniref:LpqN/LpqT family lipoprotein n=1 Tax=Mycolicibacterium sp. 120270 TaxID=3090600 RepID=UPI00299E2C6B|nr:LpqN/LpqT family lipoprotein [Mycolicibacterium sp. 120270]MDX1882657.1 LpqN/LpqT family lipoprotein [Mycolicibacterium sp. 120270]
MTGFARRWRILAGGAAACTAGVLGFAGNVATAEPGYPYLPQPAPATVAQLAPALPGAAAAQGAGIQSLAGPGVMPAAAAAQQTLVPASSVTLTDFLQSKGIKLEPQVARDFKALNIVLPVPRGWTQVPDPNVPDAFAVIADRVGGDGIYTSNAALVVYKLVGGEFDPKEAITHGFIDSQQLAAWRTTNASLADFGGMPSATIEGSYRENNMSLNTSRRHTIATAGQDKYLVSLSVTTTVGEAVAAAPATDAITNGFRISVPGGPAAAPAAAAPALTQALPR